MTPFGYEPILLHAQSRKGLGIFDCDEHAVYSNTTTLLGNGTPLPVNVTLVEGSLTAPYGGAWHTALNAKIFVRVWQAVVRAGRYRLHDWAVKVDPDAVFFPGRLRDVLKRRTPASRCGSCKLWGYTDDTCEAHVHWFLRQGLGCQEALRMTARPPPTDCGCGCDKSVCRSSQDPAAGKMVQVARQSHMSHITQESMLLHLQRKFTSPTNPRSEPVYLINCKLGLHGPIEVLTVRAVSTYVAGMDRCAGLLANKWGEDYFMDECMRRLGVKRLEEFSLLRDKACGQNPVPCVSADVVFHPFKSIKGWFTCWRQAKDRGHWPPDDLTSGKQHAADGRGRLL